MKPYYYINYDGRKALTVKYETLQSALESANQNAIFSPGEAFEILQCIGIVQTTAPTVALHRLVRLSWEYSRSQRRHTAYDENGEERFWITSEAPYGEIQGLHGYRLKLPTGKRLEFRHTVAAIKVEANHRANAQSASAPK